MRRTPISPQQAPANSEAPMQAVAAFSMLEAVYTLSPAAVERARRLELAVRLLRGGSTRRDAARLLRDRYGVSQPTAWRLVDAAADMSILDRQKGNTA